VSPPGASGLPAGTEPPRAIDEIRSTDVAQHDESPRPTGQTAASESRGTVRQEQSESRAQPTDFQLFTATSTGRVLPIFGQDLFTHAPSTFAPVSDLPAAPDYPVGPGDELVVRAWGQISIDVRATVSREGTISIPRIGVVNVSGARFEDLPGRLKAAVGRYYRNFDLAVSLGRLRSIQVFVVGHAQKPGLYTVSSLSTLINALFACGGPFSTGSMRSIQLRRADKLVGTLDLYDILLKGDKSKDQRLQSGDVVFIPPVGPLAAIAGPVKTPAIFELAGDKTSLADLVDYAGGVTTTAATQSILLERLDQLRGRIEEELPWSAATLALPLRGGDVVQLRSVSPKFFNAVTVRGSVVAPFRTAWREGLTVADLIPDASALISGGYWARAAARAFDGSSPAGRRDGPGQAQAQDRLKTDVENLVDEVNWDYAVIERLDRARIEPRLIPFNLGKAVLEKDPANNLKLEPGDIVTVFSQKDILAPSEKRTYFVRAEGEVVTPGVYQVKPGETLRQLVQRAGGFTTGCYLYGIEFTRESVRREQQARLDEIATQTERDLERTTRERLGRVSNPEDTAALQTQIQTQQRTIARLRAIRATGRMVLEVAPSASSLNDVPDVALEDGDRLFVPMRYSTVGVYGAVYSSGNYLYRAGTQLDDYLNRAGGPTRSADTGSTYVLRANGSVTARRQSGWFSSYGSTELLPNDSIVVPEELAPTSWVKELKDWSQILYQFGLGAAAIKVISQ
jgi:protein involved in polysaccharide export with SLBB domain